MFCTWATWWDTFWLTLQRNHSQCQYCQKSFSQKSNLLTVTSHHIRHIHTKEEEKTIPVSHKEVTLHYTFTQKIDHISVRCFIHRHHLTKHIRIHTKKEKPCQLSNSLQGSNKLPVVTGRYTTTSIDLKELIEFAPSAIVILMMNFFTSLFVTI